MNQNSSPCICLNFRRASKSLTDAYNQYLIPAKLTINQYSILKHIHYLAPVNVSDLSVALRLDRTTLVRSLKPLEVNKLIEDISMDGTRDRELRLTKNGEEVLFTANESWENAQSDFVKYIGKEDAEKLAELLNKIEKYKS